MDRRTLYLLACLAEECAEVQQAVMKAIRFGLKDGYPGTGRTNRGDINIESHHILALIEMLRAENILPPEDRIITETKTRRTDEYYQYSRISNSKE